MSGVRTIHGVTPTDPPRVVDAVVIGCSAGGLHALLVILAALPKGVDAAFVVVAHTAPDGTHLLPQVLAAHCALPVVEAIERDSVVSGCVYVAPPNYHLLIEADRTFALSVDDRVCFVRPAIDVLFRSAADVYHERLMGIVLTGANSDGALGLRAVKDAGGMTLVQDPAHAYADTMPLAAIAAGAAGHVLALEDMSWKIRMHCAIRRSAPGVH